MTEEIPVINELHTACVDCTFAIKDKQKQIGCKFDRLEVYKKAGAEIIKAYDAHNNEFDIINMRICMYKRGEEWAKKIPKHEQEETVNRELRVKYQSMVYFTDLPSERFVVPESMSEELQKFFVEDMKRAAYSYPTADGNGELVNSVLHLKHAGNCFNIPILEKIKEFEEGASDFIVEIKDICPSLKI